MVLQTPQAACGVTTTFNPAHICVRLPRVSLPTLPQVLPESMVPQVLQVTRAYITGSALAMGKMLDTHCD